jgi:hypothetical protein
MARARSPDNAALLILQAKVYALVHAGAAVVDTHLALRVKYTQMDALGYLLIDVLTPVGLFDEMRTQCRQMCTMFDDAQRQVADSLITAYQKGAGCGHTCVCNEQVGGYT